MTIGKTIHTLVEDIYNLVRTKRTPKEVDAEAEIERFGEAVKDMMRKEFVNRGWDARKLRLSNIGRNDRYLWNHYHGVPKERIQPHTLVKFLYGNIIEEMVLFLTRMSGHEVTCEQKECTVDGIQGHMDCRIDGVVIDVKSTSSYGFKKFQDGSLAFSDDFGYVDQGKAYAHSERETVFGWVSLDKQNGYLNCLLYDTKDEQAPAHKILKEDIVERVKHVKEMVQQEKLPPQCFAHVPDGKSGNMKLAIGCSYCQFKAACFPRVRAFAYSTGPRFLVEVKNEPKVREIPLHEAVR